MAKKRRKKATSKSTDNKDSVPSIDDPVVDKNSSQESMNESTEDTSEDSTTESSDADLFESDNEELSSLSTSEASEEISPSVSGSTKTETYLEYKHRSISAYNSKEERLELINKAYQIAVANLRACYGDDGIYAGLRQFKDYWSRDSMYASLGAICLGDHEVVKRNLSLLSKHQHRNGQIPLRVGDHFIGLKVIGIGTGTPKQLKARYTQDKLFTVSTDQNSLFILAAYVYMKKTGDKSFVFDIFRNLERAIRWNIVQDKDNDLLMEEGEYATWADSIAKTGKVLYTNVLYAASLSAMSELCRAAKKEEEEEFYSLQAKRVTEKINRSFWNGKHYIDWIDEKGRRHEEFSTDGNLLAILYGIADEKKRDSIAACMEEYKIHEPAPCRTVHPGYKWNQISFFEHIASLADYHNGLSWLWLGCLDSVCRAEIGDWERSLDTLAKISEVILAYGEVYEIYEHCKEKKPMNGISGITYRPVKRLIYKSEHPFAWSSGLFIYAYTRLISHPLKTGSDEYI